MVWVVHEWLPGSPWSIHCVGDAGCGAASRYGGFLALASTAGPLVVLLSTVFRQGPLARSLDSLRLLVFVCALDVILVRPFAEAYPRIVLPLWLCFCGSFHPFSAWCGMHDLPCTRACHGVLHRPPWPCHCVVCKALASHHDLSRDWWLFRTIWKDDKVQTITEINPNFFLIAFASHSHRDNVLKRGPWDFQKQWFALEPADLAQTIHDYTFQYMCMWVQIHNIPLSLMMEALARTLGACIGKVVMTDTRLEDGNMREFLRVRISLDTTKPLRRCVTLSRPNAKAILCPLQYEHVPIFCHGCGLIGHVVLQCPTTP
ncbi:hypothetical protein GQ457_04G019790 [Hibiscus cannabinus]